MSQLNPYGAYTEMQLGKRVDRATGNLLNGATMFNVKGGRVLANLILGEVTTVMETKAINLKLQSDPDNGGTTTDLCADLDMTAAEAGTLLTLAGAAATALQKGSSGSIISAIASMVVAEGKILASVGATHTGSIKWSLFYVPIDDGAYVEAA